MVPRDVTCALNNGQSASREANDSSTAPAGRRRKDAALRGDNDRGEVLRQQLTQRMALGPGHSSQHLVVVCMQTDRGSWTAHGSSFGPVQRRPSTAYGAPPCALCQDLAHAAS